MSLYPPRRPGHCWRCGTMVIEVLEWHVGPDKNATDQPARLGGNLPNFTQQEMVLSGPPGNPHVGSIIDVDLCLDCAEALTPAEYPLLMDALMRGWRDFMRPRSTNERTQQMWQYSQLWIGGRTVRRYWTGEDSSIIRVDRRAHGRPG